ncbi:Serine carboxypeptidase-like 20 [Linum grandiflorum]
MFYYFVTSERNPSTDPVVLWLNGGPGCSSFDGFVYEHGPFKFEAGKGKEANGELPTLHLNPYAWSKVSSVIYLDSPTGVGFSFIHNTTLYSSTDTQTASNTHKFLLKWLKVFPEFRSNPFYLAGESYAGVYIPTLAAQIVQGIKARVEPVINLKGYMIGNGVTDKEFDGNALVPFAHGMALISDDLYEGANSACRGNYANPNSPLSCQHRLDQIDAALIGLNIYDVLEPCYHSTSQPSNTTRRNEIPRSFRELGRRTEEEKKQRLVPVRKRMFGRAWPFRAPVLDGIVPLWPQLSTSTNSIVPCTNDEVATAWLNNAAVRKALHVPLDAENDPWEVCVGMLSLLYTHDSGSMIPYHKNLTSLGYRALIYSGDHDMCVPFTGTQAWTRSLGYKIVDPWRPWFSSDSQVAGYLQGYDNNLIFLTVKGSGHTVPEYKPREALDFYSRWLDAKSI